MTCPRLIWTPLRRTNPHFDDDALQRLDPGWAVRARTSPGGTAPVQVAAQIEAAQAWISDERTRAEAAAPKLPLA